MLQDMLDDNAFYIGFSDWAMLVVSFKWIQSWLFPKSRQGGNVGVTTCSRFSMKPGEYCSRFVKQAVNWMFAISFVNSMETQIP